MKKLLTLSLVFCAIVCQAQTVKVNGTPVYSTASTDTIVARAVRPFTLQLGVLQNTINQQQIAITAANTTITTLQSTVATLQAALPRPLFPDTVNSFSLVPGVKVDTLILKYPIIVK